MDPDEDTGERANRLPDVSVAIAHWHVRSWGGAEYLVTMLADVLGRDRVYTMGAPDPDESNPYGDVEFYNLLDDQSPLRRLQGQIGRAFEYALWEDVDWREYGDIDILITSGSTTRAVITPDDVLHVNYCHSPPRWFYDLYHDRKSGLLGRMARPFLRHLRTRDATIDPRVDHYLANSPVIERRLWKYYKRNATVLYPPIELDKYEPAGEEGYYLHLGRLDKEKGVPAVVEAFSGTDRRLVLIGDEGDVDRETRQIIERQETIEYRGFVEESEKIDLLSRCRAVIFNGQNEDFGIVPIEANASGKACLAREEGFPRLYIEEGINGHLHDGSPEEIRRAIERFERQGVEAPARTVQQFSEEGFTARLEEYLTNRLHEFRLDDIE